MISLMMCDDHIETLDATLGGFMNDKRFTICGKATSGEDCIKLIDNGIIPDVLILDISMPKGMNGYNVAKYFQKKSLPLHIVVYSSFDDINAVKAMIHFGVKGFVCKFDSLKMLKHSIDQVIIGNYYFTNNMAFSKQEISTMINNPVAWAENITDKELLTMKLLSKGIPRKQAATEMNISESALAKKISRVFKKTITNSITGAINFLEKVGLVDRNN